jgi:hypothetical protein
MFCSLVVFVLATSYVLFGGLTQLFQGVLEWKDAGFVFGMSFGMGAVLAAIVYAVLSFVARGLNAGEREDEHYRPSRPVIVALAIVLAATIGYSVRTSYKVGAAQKAEIDRQREAAEQRALAMKSAAQAEQARLAALTPEQRAAEERQNRERQAAAAKAAAERLAKGQADTEAKVAKKKRRDAQLQLAGTGAVELKHAMKDPEAFELKSLYVTTSGASCYDFRAKNSFGATFPGRAVMNAKGKMFLQERDGDRFASVWNADCTKDGGDDITALVKRLGILDK